MTAHVTTGSTCCCSPEWQAGRALWLAAALLIGLLGAMGCAKSELADDPGLAGDDFGIGISLGLDVVDARSVVGSRDHVKYWVITREELQGRSPYVEKPDNGDLVVALYHEYPEGGGAAGDPMLYGRINEIRCYLANTEDSRVKLQGHPVAGLNPAGIEAVFGPPLEKVVSSDENSHLTYHFNWPAEENQPVPGLMIELVTSHNPAGNCFAVLLSLTPQL